MIAGLDSATPPTLAQAQAAQAAGIRVWSGYFGGPGIAAWSDDDFRVVLAAGMQSIAYCSGWSDPGYCRARADALGIFFAVDVEHLIRDDGPWVQGWLDNSSRGGLYGNGPVHSGRVCSFHQYSGYFGYDPKAIWPLNLAQPAGLLAWQWYGTHTEFGVGVDRSWLDDSFASIEGDDMYTQADRDRDNAFALRAPKIDSTADYASAILNALNNSDHGLAAIKAAIGSAGGSGDLTVLSQKVDQLIADVNKPKVITIT